MLAHTQTHKVVSILLGLCFQSLYFPIKVKIVSLVLPNSKMALTENGNNSM